ncbi:MAG: ectoine/hydroxyectoine ABC transporter substrate-binding protein EhuB [Pseudomonadota bacterium]
MSIGLAAVALLGLAPRSVAAQTVYDKAKEAGYIRVGFPNQVPYAYATPDGKLTGADSEVARKVIAHMGIKEMDGVLTEFASLIPGLKSKRFDIVLAMFVNPTRCKEVAFSEPIYGIGQALIVKTGNPKHIEGYDDLIKRNDLKFAIMSGAVQGIYAQKLGIPDGRVGAFPDGPSALSAVAAGRADAFGISALPARKLVETAGSAAGVEILPGLKDPIIDGRPARGYGAFAFRKEDQDLVAAFNAALKSFLGTPEHLETIAPFGFTNSNLPDTTTAQLCS